MMNIWQDEEGSYQFILTIIQVQIAKRIGLSLSRDSKCDELYASMECAMRHAEEEHLLDLRYITTYDILFLHIMGFFPFFSLLRY